ncbi:MAG: hypothetical protein LBH81_00745 [Rickettsiales bacterium]|jgi:hypothetical protein|nr:hypothetical protein [Rickettsiales bacterium]
MKKIILSFFVSLFALPAFALTPLDPTYSVGKGQFFAGFAAAFAKPDIGGADNGRVLMSLDSLQYGFGDLLTIFLEKKSVSANAIGVDYTLIHGREFNLDLIGKYELTVSDTVPTGGAKIYGVMDDKWSWSATGLLRYRSYAYVYDFFAVDLLFQGRLLYQMNPKWGIFAEMNYNVLLENYDNQYHTEFIWQRDMTIGALYNISKNAAVMPYIARNFKSVRSNGGLDTDLSDGDISVGARFGIQF